MYNLTQAFSIAGWFLRTGVSLPLTHHTPTGVKVEYSVFSSPPCCVLQAGTLKLKEARRKRLHKYTPVWICRSRDRCSFRKLPGSSYTSLLHSSKRGRFKTLGSLLFMFRVRTVQVCLNAEKPQWILDKWSQLQEQRSAVFNQFNFAKCSSYAHA